MTNTREQLEIIRALQLSLEAATDAGMLDVLAIYIHPDIINQFCEAVNEMEKDQGRHQ